MTDTEKLQIMAACNIDDPTESKKVYDLRINSHGSADPMRPDFFDDVEKMVAPYQLDPDDYIIVELPTRCYRICKSDLATYKGHDTESRKAILKFLKRSGASAEMLEQL